MMITIGRSPKCDIMIADEYATPRHCEVFQLLGKWMVRDLGSTNGTYIIREGARLKVGFGGMLRLKIGDVIVVGRTELPPWDRS